MLPTQKAKMKKNKKIQNLNIFMTTERGGGGWGGGEGDRWRVLKREWRIEIPCECVIRDIEEDYK